jgi:ABC-type phosphate transport system auxiliary subunit
VSPDLATVIVQVAGLREVSASTTATEALLAQIEDRLTEGYAWALTGDAWSMRIEQRLHELGSDTCVVFDDRGLHALAREHARLRRDLIALRRELAALRRERDRLRADWRASSG